MSSRNVVRRTHRGRGWGWGEVEEVIKDHMISFKNGSVLRRKNVGDEKRNAVGQFHGLLKETVYGLLKQIGEQARRRRRT